MTTVTFPPLEPWQQDVHESMKNCYKTGKIFTVKARRQVGKSILCAVELITMSLEHKGTSIMIEPTLTQCRRVYLQIKNWLEGTPIIKKFNDQMLEIIFYNGSEIIFKSAEQRQRLRGFTVTNLLIIDECAFCSDEIIEICLPFCDANNAPILLVSTPMFASGLFYTFFSNPDGINSFSFDWATYDVSKYIAPDKLEFYRKTMNSTKFTTEMLGEFLTDGAFVFRNILKCIYKPTNVKDPIYAGIDWGSGSSGDYTVLTLMNEDRQVTEIWSTQDMDPIQQIEQIYYIIKKHPTLKNVKVEFNSIGSVYYSLLKSKCGNLIQKFNTSNTSKREIIENLANAFLKEQVHILDDDELINELQHFAVQKLATGYTYNGIGAHDDYVISLAICYDNFNKKKGTYNIKFN